MGGQVMTPLDSGDALVPESNRFAYLMRVGILPRLCATAPVAVKAPDSGLLNLQWNLGEMRCVG